MSLAAPPPNMTANGALPWQANLNTHLICPDCRRDPPNLIEDTANADTICGDCGMVLADRLISYESEWRTFNSDEGKGDDPNRVGEADNELLTGSNTGTTIGGGANASKETRRLKRAQAAQQDSKADKILTTAYNQIDQWGDRAALPTKVRTTAKQYYKRVFEAGQFKGKNVDIVLASCLFLACRQHKVARSFNEMFALTNVPKKDIGRNYKMLEKFLVSDSTNKLNSIEAEGGIIGRDQVEYKTTVSTKPDQLCGRFCNMLGLPWKVQTVAESLARGVANISELAGRSPLSNAAACTYLASHLYGIGKSTKDISNVAGVSDATIKHAYKYLHAKRDTMIEKEWLGVQPGGLVGDLKNLPPAPAS
jgi:transcription initiation factor TFIIB